jgi:hypothetical protein
MRSSSATARRSPPESSPPRVSGSCRKCFRALDFASDQPFVPLHSAAGDCNGMYCASCWVNHILAHVQRGSKPITCPIPRTGKSCVLNSSELTFILTRLQKSSLVTSDRRAQRESAASPPAIVKSVRGGNGSAPATPRVEKPSITSPSTPPATPGYCGFSRKVQCLGCRGWVVFGKLEQSKGSACVAHLNCVP